MMDTGKTTFTTAEAMAEKLEQYIKEEQDGAIDLVLGESMGGATAGMLFHRQKVKAIPHNSIAIFNNTAESTLTFEKK